MPAITDRPPGEADANVLCINRGSSSLKFGLYHVAEGQAFALLVGQAPVEPAAAADGDSLDDLAVIDAGTIEAVDARGIVWRAPQTMTKGEPATRLDATSTMAGIATLIRTAKMPAPDVIAHRIVHGGPALQAHCVIDDEVTAALVDAVPFARLHMPPALALLMAAGRTFPDATQVACLDTAFHHGLPDVARVLPIAGAAQGLRRYGFHGLSCESILHALGDEPPRRTIVAHLGHGASVTAVRSGRSIDTSMGLTPAGGLVMGTRSGDLDPGLIIHLLRTQPLDVADIERQLERESGMLGVSGISGDMRVLRAAASGSDAAQLAIAIFCRSAAKQIAAMVAVLDGLDLLVFTGGIGEHDAGVRAAICRDLYWIGVHIDPRANAVSRSRIEGESSRCAVRVMASNEDAQMARIAAHLVPGGGGYGAITAA